MKSRCSLSALMSAVTASTALCSPTHGATPASERGPSNEYGLAFGLRSGYGIPIGSTARDSSFSDAIKGMIPIWVDGGFRFSPYVYIGAFFQYGFGLVPSNSGCNAPGVSCSESDVRLGINGHYHFIPSGPVDPWIGIGAAYEWLNANVSGTGAQTSTAFLSVRGFEFVNAQLGLDVKLLDAVSMGPFVAFSISQYSTAEVGSGSVSISADIQNKAIHDWLIFGLRGQFNVNLN